MVRMLQIGCLLVFACLFGCGRGLFFEDASSVTVTPLSTVISVVVGDGTVQRSRVAQIVVTFSLPIDSISVTSDSFVVKKLPSNTTIITSVAWNSDYTVATITFSGTGTTSDSLDDGNYNLFIYGDTFTATNGTHADADGDTTEGGTYNYNTANGAVLFRYFGDSNGDRCVGGNPSVDWSTFQATYNLTTNDYPVFNTNFDINQDGIVDFGIDFLAYVNRANHCLAQP